jgi:hypothetical protein
MGRAAEAKQVAGDDKLFQEQPEARGSSGSHLPGAPRPGSLSAARRVMAYAIGGTGLISQVRVIGLEEPGPGRNGHSLNRRRLVSIGALEDAPAADNGLQHGDVLDFQRRHLDRIFGKHHKIGELPDFD